LEKFQTLKIGFKLEEEHSQKNMIVRNPPYKFNAPDGGSHNILSAKRSLPRA
jgi:hypothetical protein